LNKLAAAISILIATFSSVSFAQRGQGGAAQPPQTPRATAPFDLTGYWVSIVSEDWRWRMVTPARGDYASVPLNDEGRKAADAWDLTKDKAAGTECKAFGAPALLRLPTRVHVTWQDDNTLKLETDSGQQVRLLQFAAAQTPATTERQWQGSSKAEWFKHPQSTGLGFGAAGGRGGFAGGNLKVVTTGLRAGYLRKNGVPYSEDSVLTEYFNRHSAPDGSQWFTVTTVVEDPRYLTMPFITSSSFKKEADASKWRPTACVLDPPRE